MRIQSTGLLLSALLIAAGCGGGGGDGAKGGGGGAAGSARGGSGGAGRGGTTGGGGSGGIGGVGGIGGIGGSGGTSGAGGSTGGSGGSTGGIGGSGGGSGGTGGTTPVDACAATPSACSVNATCTTTSTGFTCACKSGYTGDGVTCADVDECAAANGGCDVNATCTNTPGTRTCACKTGYSGDGITCADVDECATNRGGCSANADCSNTPGSHACTCKSGFTGDGVTCTDIDECATNHGGCDALVMCNNTPGSHTCGNCPAGYTGGGASGCTDIDECTAGTANCSANANCANSPGSFACACKTGFTGTGVVCTACSVCAAGQYQTAACTATTNTACATCPTGCAACTGATTCTACGQGYHLVGSACVACTACGAGQFQVSACTPTQDTVCNTCSTCGAGQYRTAACAGSSDTTCAACTVCAVGQYQTAACSPTSNATCAACDSTCTACTGIGACTGCASGRYLSGGTCQLCSTCTAGQYRAVACTSTANTVCNTCSACGAGQYETGACGGTSDRVCSACTPCGSMQWEDGACTPTSNRSCAMCAVCGASQYRVAACGATTNTVCAACSSCGAGKYQTAACSATADTVCATCTPCPVGQFVTMACGGTTDTVCATCDAHCDACTGPTACTACAAGFALLAGSCVSTGSSCLGIHTANPSAPDGVYQLDPDGGSSANAFFAYCDMTTDGGGWMKILQYTNAAYTPTTAAVGNIAVAGISAMAKMADADVNSLANLATNREYRFQGATSTKKLFMKVSAPWNDTARSHGLILTSTALACEATTSCAYIPVTATMRPTIDTFSWNPASTTFNNEDRYFTDYDAPINCYITGSTTQRCYCAGSSVGHALIPNFSIWTREVPVRNDGIILYPLDENTGMAVGDASGYGRNATVIAGGWTPGHTGSALLGALRTDAAVPVTNAVTVSLWVRRDGPGTADTRIVSWDNDGLELGDVNHANNLGVSVPGLGWQATGTSFGTGFHHVAVSVGGGTIRVYFDGMQKYIGGATVNLAGQMSIGTRWNGAQSWVGAVDQVRVYDRALTSAEIAILSQE